MYQLVNLHYHSPVRKYCPVANSAGKFVKFLKFKYLKIYHFTWQAACRQMQHLFNGLKSGFDSGEFIIFTASPAIKGVAPLQSCEICLHNCLTLAKITQHNNDAHQPQN